MSNNDKKCYKIAKNVEKFSKFKCIASIKGDYKAVHIYFKKDNNHYQWELQLWNVADENTNYMSHECYKQDYTKWEIIFKNMKGETE